MKKLHCILTFFISALSGFIHGQSVEINCVQVVGNDIQISWNPTSFVGAFVSYDIYASADGNPYTLVASITNPNITSYTLNSSPNLFNSCFYVATTLNFGTFNSTDAFCNILLEANASVSPPGIVELTWNAPTSNASWLSNTNAEVWLEYPSGTWSLVSTLPGNAVSYDYEVTTCGDYLNFQIIYSNNLLCPFNSNFSGGNFNDQTAPAIPTFETITVNPLTGLVEINWNVNPSGDTDGYIVYSCNGTNVTLIDTVFGRNTTQFNDLLSTASQGSECYLLAAIDTCYAGTPPSPNTSPTSGVCNCTIFLQPTSYTLCDQFIPFEWSAYTGWPVDHYDIMHSEDGVNYTSVATQLGSELQGEHNFITISNGTHYYYIQATSITGVISNSNVQTLNINYPSTPQFHYLASASVRTDDTVDVTVRTETNSVPHLYIFQRQNIFNVNEWETIGEISGSTGNFVTFNDKEVTPQSLSYSYRVILKNPCGYYIDTTNVGTTILLRGEDFQEELYNTLFWTEYQNWENGVEQYSLYRSIDSAAESFVELIATPPYSFNDNVSDYIESEGKFCYRVQANSSPIADFPGEIFNAYSNQVCLDYDPLIWIPSAFVIDGFNRTFFPVISFADTSTYRMIIYSRWGDVIFDNSSYNTPWTGEMRKDYVHENAYVYHIMIENNQGVLFERRGTVTLLNDRDQ